jgi:hypothetical protein
MPGFERIPEIPRGLEFSWWTLLKLMRDALLTIINYFERIDDAWTVPLLKNSWEHYDSPYYSASYRKDLNDIVHLTGVVKSGTIGQNVFILPENYRPSNSRIYPVASNGAFGAVTVKSTGEVEATVGNNAYFSLDGVSFRAE